MSIEKALYQAPVGLDSLATEEEPIEIEIVALGIEELDEDEAVEGDFDENLAEFIDEKELLQIAGDLIGDFEEDIASRKDWIQTYVDGLELLGMKIEERTEPWEGACGSITLY